MLYICVRNVKQNRLLGQNQIHIIVELIEISAILVQIKLYKQINEDTCGKLTKILGNKN